MRGQKVRCQKPDRREVERRDVISSPLRVGMWAGEGVGGEMGSQKSGGKIFSRRSGRAHEGHKGEDRRLGVRSQTGEILGSEILRGET